MAQTMAKPPPQEQGSALIIPIPHRVLGIGYHVEARPLKTSVLSQSSPSHTTRVKNELISVNLAISSSAHDVTLTRRCHQSC
jgi:hypothetical protein